MNKVALALAVLTVGLLNVILAFGPGTRGPMFNAAIEVLPFVMVPSSLMLGLIFWHTGHQWFACMFLLNVAVFLIVLGFLLSGVPPTEQFLFVADVLQLNLYLLALGKHWSLFANPITAVQWPPSVSVQR